MQFHAYFSQILAYIAPTEVGLVKGRVCMQEHVWRVWGHNYEGEDLRSSYGDGLPLLK